ncbi:MAG TPA: hypothetical protein VLB69_11575 [Rudaea sp.]|nr:hypothetical protein [Rudaea sp.]
MFGEDFEAFPTCASASGFALLATPASRANTLGTQNRYLVKVRSCGDAGSNALGAAGAPASWTTTIDPTSLPLASNGYGVGLLTVVVPSDADAGDVNLDVTATANANAVHANAELNIANQYIVTIPDGTGNGDHHFPPSLSLKVGTLLRILDDSTAPHRIHGEGNVGFTHQASLMTQGQEYDMTPTVSGTGDFYCHDHGIAAGKTNVTVVP